MSGGFFKRLARGLTRSRHAIGDRIDDAVSSHDTIDGALLEEVEEILITADLGVSTAVNLMKAIDDEIRYNKLKDPRRLWEVLEHHLLKTVTQVPARPLGLQKTPTVVLVVGVNGVGKTTTIGKLASHFAGNGKKVVMAAGDTFRAAAVEQLKLWGDKLGVDVIHHREGADASAVVFDACQAASSRGVDLLLIDTAGRLHTNVNLMAELEKVRRVITKVIPDAPHEVLLVLDANSGQNAMSQAKTFCAAVDVTGMVLTKMDSTAKGGILVNLIATFGRPVYYVGVGESAEDLQPFDPEGYVKALFKA